MPYKKGGAAEARAKVRRTAKRRIARLEKEIATSDSAHQRDLFRSQIENLREGIERTYERNPHTHKATGYQHDQLRMAVQNLTRANEQSLIGTSSTARRNFITQQELNTAKQYDVIEGKVSKYTKEEVAVFYAATQEAWQNLPSTANRNRAILEYYAQKYPNKYKGMTLEEFVSDVLHSNEEAVRIAHHQTEYLEESGELTPEEIEQATEGSAIWATGVQSVSQYNAAQSYVNRPE